MGKIIDILEGIIMIFVNFSITMFYVFKDMRNRDKTEFKEFGLTLYCGRQGSGKTTHMVHYLERMRKKYPEVRIFTNFDYKHQERQLEGWEDILTLRNGTKGVIFAIDEIHSEFSSAAWKNFPEEMLKEVSQQRKQRVKIVGTSQVYTRVVKQLREQCFEVVECFTIAQRWSFAKCFDAEDYNDFIAGSATQEKKREIRRKWRFNFVQSDDFRELYDTYGKIERMRQAGFVDRASRTFSEQ